MMKKDFNLAAILQSKLSNRYDKAKVKVPKNDMDSPTCTMYVFIFQFTLLNKKIVPLRKNGMV